MTTVTTAPEAEYWLQTGWMEEPGAELGIRKPVIKAHGSSKAKGIKNAIRQAKTCVENDLCGTMQSALDELAAANKPEE